MAKIISLAAVRAQRALASTQGEVESEFQRVRKTLNRTALATPSDLFKSKEWAMLTAVRGIIEIALLDGDWNSARQRITELKRRTSICIVQTR